MGEAKVRGVEKVTIQRAKLLAEFLVAAFAVKAISDYRMTNRGEVYPDLMCAACLDPDLQKTKPAEAFDYPIFSVRRASSRLAGSHLRPLGWMSSNGQVDRCAALARSAVDESNVSFLYLPILKCSAQTRMRHVVFRNDQQSRGVLIETVNDPWTGCSTGIRQIMKMKQQPMYNGTCF